ncbi:right-handed parallel beta-helix repeat-containing protein [Treponema sp. JC4]|uniref:right-handed parallel beta-helix repeat-containing protein n=1 Tax=Treponema sp. JC4 TaxID=1124982 RepID=UPI0012DCC41E|nr:right-handed parallel beta-helix repeat-containing protein [Treponema sp. JC4]
MNKILLSLFVYLGTLLLPSCDMFNLSVKDFFENSIDGLGIENITLPEGTQGSDGILCVATDSVQNLSFELRNPQKKAFSVKYEFEGDDVKTLAGDTALTYTQGSDRYSAKITFSQEFLFELDKANYDLKKLSGKIYLTDDSESVIYDTCNVSARANSIPPVALGAMLQADQGVAAGSYILCFYIPVLNGTVHQKDLHKLIINGNAYYFSDGKISGGLAEIYSDEDFTERSSDFYTSTPVTYPLGADTSIYPVFPGVAGKPAEAYAAVYYKSGIALSSSDTTFNITFEDDYGLSNSISASNRIPVIDIPKITDAEGNPLSSGAPLEADIDTRLYTISITHSGKAYYNSEESLDCAPVTISYTVRETNGKPVFDGNISEISGTTNDDIDIDLPPGTYEITAFAAKEGYITSSVAAVSNVTITCPAIFYVSSSGSDEDSGSRTKPVATVTAALSKLSDTLADDSTLTEGKIFITSDLEINQEINLTTYKFADLLPVRNITISGYDGLRTINANSKCRVLQIGWTNGNINLENLIFKGGTTSDNQGGGGLFVSSSDASGKTLEIKNCKFINNTTDYTGTAILIKSDYTINITECEISGNTLNGAAGSAGIDATQMGVGTYITIKDTKITDNTVVSPDTSLTAFGSALNGTAATRLSGGVTISGNSITGVSTGTDSSNYSAVNNSMGLKISGANIIKDNTLIFNDNTNASRNIVLPYTSGSSASQKLNILGDISGSTIYVSIPSSSIINDVTFTSGYGTTNTALPGSVFISDCNYAIGLDSSGNEAAFVLSGGSFTNPFGITMTFALSASAISAGSASELAVTPTIMQNGTDITASVLSEISWNLVLSTGSTDVTSSNTNILTIDAANALPDTYTLYIAATLYGITYDDSVTVICE